MLLLISAKSLQPKSQLMAHIKVKLKIPQLTLAKIAQMGRHETVNTRSEHYRAQSLLKVTFLFNLFCSNTILADLTE